MVGCGNVFGYVTPPKPPHEEMKLFILSSPLFLSEDAPQVYMALDGAHHKLPEEFSFT
jgi:hypothetical protein